MTTAFQFSGGKDSTAALYWMKPFWDSMRFYTLDSGDMFPETKAFIERVAAELPNHTWVQGAQRQAIEAFGPPTDLVPAASSAQAHAAGIKAAAPLQNRLDCCFRSKMLPMYQRMCEDSITHIVRGQRKEDVWKGPLVSGDADKYFTVIYPIEDWTEQQVWDYLISIDRVPPLYDQNIRRSGDCMTCSAWLGDGRIDYLKKNHPNEYMTVRSRLLQILPLVRKDYERIYQASR